MIREFYADEAESENRKYFRENYNYLQEKRYLRPEVLAKFDSLSPEEQDKVVALLKDVISKEEQISNLGREISQTIKDFDAIMLK